ncbi:hypothetical protein G7Y79_00055g089530 [Physcia stellaris]|nr:hypothetical protein G7Y79_00055g089530 [Physcia stellaris]
MGHSFCSGPSIPSGLRTDIATPKQTIKHTPRSPGFTPERRLPTDDFADSRNLHAIKDLLLEDPSSLIHTESRRRKKIVDLFARPAHLSSKQVKQMLLSRRSLSPHSTTQPYPLSLARDVAPRTTKDGKKYFQIATSSSMYECGNPSVYQVNHRQTVSGVESPLPSLDNIDPYYLGITEEHPHLIISDRESRQSQGADNSSHTETSLPPKPSQLSNAILGKGSSATCYLPKMNDVSGLAERQTSPGSKARIYGPKVNRSPKRASAKKMHNRPLPSEVQPPAPLTIPLRSTAQSPKTPRSSFEEPHKELQASPVPRSYSKPPSVQSITNSIADDAQSEASVGVVSMAQSAEVVRAGFHNSGGHKFPKPGPAPTGALPSLPEGLDSKLDIVYLPSVQDHVGNTLQSSPTRPISRSPAKKNRYRPLDDAINKDTAKLLPVQTRSRPKHASQSPNLGISPKPDVEEPCEKALTPDDTPRGHEEARESWRQIRAQSRKALKLRDMDRLRIQDDNVPPVGRTDESTTAGAQDKELQTKVAKMKESYSSPALLPGYQPTELTGFQPSAPHAVSRPGKPDLRPSSQISPVLVLAEHAPIQLSSNTQSEYSKSKSFTHQQSPAKDSQHFRSPSLPSFPSSDEDSAKRRTTPPATSNSSIRHPAARSRKAASNRASSYHPQAYHAELSDLEFRLSARITELEKKNAMLLNAFVAVINTSAGLAAVDQSPAPFSHDGSTSNGGYRSSGLSGGRGARSSGTSGGYRSSHGELERVVEGSGHGTGHVNGNGKERDTEEGGG